MQASLPIVACDVILVDGVMRPLSPKTFNGTSWQVTHRLKNIKIFCFVIAILSDFRVFLMMMNKINE